MSYGYLCSNAIKSLNEEKFRFNKEFIRTGTYNSMVKSQASNFHEDISNDYLAKISIPKIGINRYLYDINSKNNNVDKNIEILKSSTMPDIKGGNFILAAHSGYSSIAYFHNLHKLKIGDDVILEYKNKSYTYKVSFMYDVVKTGKVAIKRDKNETAITMITCKGEDKQLIVIGYLI